MKEFNFNSQVCTDKNQSEHLLALGLKKETADMYYRFYDKNTYEINPTWETIWEDRAEYKNIIPAWSLHRLIEMVALCPYEIYPKDNVFEDIIDDIEEAIKEGYFNKEYLV